MHLPDLPLVVLDTETTGVIAGVHRIVEIAMVRADGGAIAEEWEHLVAPDDELPPTVQMLTRIRPQDLAGKPKFSELHDAIRAFVPDNALLVGQNLGFDLQFLKREGIDWTERPWIDTSMLASVVFPDCPSFSLGYLSTELALPHEPKHRALGDVHATLALLGKIWERFLELPEDRAAEARALFGRSTEGMRRFIEALPKSTAKTLPTWLKERSRVPAHVSQGTSPLAVPKSGSIALADDGLNPDTLGAVLRGCLADSAHQHWIGVKNLHSILVRSALPEGVTVLYPAPFLPDPTAVDLLLKQPALAAEEATLAVKLAWYKPATRDGLPLHGGERDVWSGKIGCSETSAAYTRQFATDATVRLIDHRQLLTLLADASPEGRERFAANTHVVIDDASMLEDTATKAYGIYLSLDDLRAAARGDDALTKLADLAELWVAKVRKTEDQHMLVTADLSHPETKAIREQATQLLTTIATPRTRELLTDLAAALDVAALPGTIAWIELKPGGGQALQRFPEDIALLLEKHLYSRFPTTLLRPPKVPLVAVLPPSERIVEPAFAPPPHSTIPLTIDTDRPSSALIADPPDGKTIVLAGSKRVIEQIYVQYTEPLEARGITLICQGFGGGQGRMEAEFLAAAAPALLVVTPWMYETFDLVPGSVDTLVLDTLPFDHPSQPVVRRRSERCRNGFGEYSLPRLLHRIFRLLRNFSRQRTAQGCMMVLDQRLATKGYGKDVQAYLELLCAGAEQTPAPKKKDGPAQLSLL